MSAEKVEGTILLEGMLQGRMPDDSAFDSRLREWLDFMRQLGLPFSLSVSGGSFNLLPDDGAASVMPWGDPPQDALQQALQQLLALFDNARQGELFSTLRSREFRRGEEVQTLYAFAGGQVQPHTRTVAAATTRPPEPFSLRQRLALAAGGLVMAAILVGLALLFPGVRTMIGQLFATVHRVDPNDIQIDTGAFAEYFACRVDEEKSGWVGLTLRLRRTGRYPTDERALATAAADSQTDLRRRLALESLVRGYVRVEISDHEGKFVKHADFRLAELREKDEIELAIPFPTGVRVGGIAIVPL